MTLNPIVLDDLTWEQMTTAIRGRIPAESAGSWTLHAPVDPGITLLELYAWLLEQRLYWLDQVPDTFVDAVLRLLGMPERKPASPATTVLWFTSTGPPAPAAQPAPTVTPGTPFSCDPLDQVGMSLTQDVTVLQVAGLSVTADPQIAGPLIVSATGKDPGTVDARPMGGLALLPTNGEPGQARITITMPAPVPAEAGQWLSLLAELDVPDRVYPAWSPDAVSGVPPPANLTWQYQDGGAVTAFAAGDVDDGTAGLRRSGIVRVRIPDAWRTEAAAASANHVLIIGTQKCTFSSPPRLLRLCINAGQAVQQRTVTGDPTLLVDQVRNWLPLPGRQLELLPSAAGQLLTASLNLLETDGETHEWKQTTDFTVHGPDDRVFVVDRDRGALEFGDGLTGQIPLPEATAPSDQLLQISWSIGGGASANGGLTSWQPTDLASIPATLAGLTVQNLVPVTGGLDPETISQARVRAAATLSERHRGVTKPDYETIALETPGVGVARALVQVGDHPKFPCTPVAGAISVYLVPDAPRRSEDWDRPDFTSHPMPDPGLFSAVSNRVGEGRLMGTELSVRPPRYHPVRLQVTLAGMSADLAGTRATLTTALRHYLDPISGGDGGSGWVFGGPLRPSAFLRTAQNAVTCNTQVLAVAIWVVSGQRWESCSDVPIAANELTFLESLELQTRPAAAQPGSQP
jgi:predicted phage baseplate assembly protein